MIQIEVYTAFFENSESDKGITSYKSFLQATTCSKDAPNSKYDTQPQQLQQDSSCELVDNSFTINSML